jgi:hypothetical protein
MQDEHQGVSSIPLATCGGVASVTGTSMKGDLDERPCVAITVSGITYSLAIMLVNGRASRLASEIDFEFRNEVTKRLVDLVASLGGVSDDIECRVSTQRVDLVRTLWILLPSSVDKIGLVEKVAVCIDSALDAMAGKDDPFL